MQHPAWVLVIVGVLIAVVGLVWLLAPSIPWLGKLPGDIAIERENFRFYFPLATCILLSLVLTGIMWLVRCFTHGRHCRRKGIAANFGFWRENGLSIQFEWLRAAA